MPDNRSALLTCSCVMFPLQSTVDQAIRVHMNDQVRFSNLRHASLAAAVIPPQF